MRRSILVLFVVCIAVFCGINTRAVVPEGWTYHNGDYAYAPGSSAWFYFNRVDEQWVVDLHTDSWGTLDNLPKGWYYHMWPYAYSSSLGHWNWFNLSDAQWVCNMTAGVWSLLGYDPAPDGMTTIPHGTNAGTDPGFGAYSLTVETFYMDKCEVTKALWDEVYEWAIANGYDFDNPGSGKAANHPVHSVNWYDVVKWCNARSEMEERTPVYRVQTVVIPGWPPVLTTYKSGQVDIDASWLDAGADGYRLPTDVEWEYAARGGVAGRRFPWGDTIQHARANYKSSDWYSYDTSPTRGYHPAYNDGTAPFTSPIASFTANGYGLHDMAGNVWERCFDWFPGGEGSHRVNRGGAWDDISASCLIGGRFGNGPDRCDDNIGFRTVLTAAP